MDVSFTISRLFRLIALLLAVKILSIIDGFRHLFVFKSSGGVAAIGASLFVHPAMNNAPPAHDLHAILPCPAFVGSFELARRDPKTAVRVPQHSRGGGALHLQPLRGVHRLSRCARRDPRRDDPPAAAFGSVAGRPEAELVHALVGGCGVASAESQRRARLAGGRRGTDSVSGAPCGVVPWEAVHAGIGRWVDPCVWIMPGQVV